MTWSNQVAVVTGGARGIGRAIALLLAKRGAALCVNYAARADAAEQVASEIKGEGGRSITAGADVADFRAVQVMIEQAEAQLGPVAILAAAQGLPHWQCRRSFACDAAKQVESSSRRCAAARSSER